MALDRESVVRTALRLLDQVGLYGLTLRKLATELGVRAPALYWHFKNKQELLDEMATTVFADSIREFGMPDESRLWSEWVMEYGKTLRRTLLRYRDGAKMFSGTYLTDPSMYAPMEAALRKLTRDGFSLSDAVNGLATIYYYVVGFTIEEQAVYPSPGERNELYDPARREARIDHQKFPLALAAGEHSFQNFDQRFEHGLQIIVSGMRR